MFSFLNYMNCSLSILKNLFYINTTNNRKRKGSLFHNQRLIQARFNYSALYFIILTTHLFPSALNHSTQNKYLPFYFWKKKMPTEILYYLENNIKSSTAIKMKYNLIFSVDYFQLLIILFIICLPYFASVLKLITIISISKRLVSLDMQTM